MLTLSRRRWIPRALPRLVGLNAIRPTSDSVSIARDSTEKTFCHPAVADPNAARMIFDDRLDAWPAIFFMVIVTVVIIASTREGVLVASGGKRRPRLKRRSHHRG